MRYPHRLGHHWARNLTRARSGVDCAIAHDGRDADEMAARLCRFLATAGRLVGFLVLPGLLMLGLLHWANP